MICSNCQDSAHFWDSIAKGLVWPDSAYFLDSVTVFLVWPDSGFSWDSVTLCLVWPDSAYFVDSVAVCLICPYSAYCWNSVVLQYIWSGRIQLIFRTVGMALLYTIMSGLAEVKTIFGTVWLFVCSGRNQVIFWTV